MKQRLSFKTEYVWLAAIVVLALYLRLWGIGFDLPYVGYISDETRTVDHSLQIMRAGLLDGAAWGIGTLYFYVQAAVNVPIFWLAGITGPDAVPTFVELQTAHNITAPNIGMPYPAPQIYYWGRVLVAVFGSASVVVLYLIGRTLKSARVGLAAAFFLAAFALHIEFSHYLIRTVPALFLLLLAFYVILQAYNRHSWWLYLFSLLPAFAAIYAKQNSLIILCPLAAGVAMSLWHEFQTRERRQFALTAATAVGVALALFVAVWVLTGFNILQYVQSLVNRVLYHPFVYGGTWLGASGENTAQWMARQFFVERPEKYMLLLSLPGVLAALALRGRGALLLSVVVPYLVVFSFFTVRWLHWLLPVMAMMLLLSALFLDWLFETARNALPTVDARLLGALHIGLLLAVAWPSISFAAAQNSVAVRPDVRNLVDGWVQQNLPPGATLVVDEYGPYITADNFNVIYVNSITDKDVQTYRTEGVDYLVGNGLKLITFLNALSDPRTGDVANEQTARAYQMMTELTPIHEFKGPFIFTPDMQVIIFQIE
ncbi:MAG: hypothetical protein D6768_17365 [Chloroflexi bacterium]|nr:MAG: hypothetical protein D6768_17365 [Chloroflexota bacterium]